ncbi:MAG: cobalt ECF transporter T component CbiQ [Alistipes sp.]|nr:cobalt ECF transporter T component CbiQ [Alistipes senegalensis]MCM1251102.1 cobalt ECF transporter T component CbiQ [Alistipes sp.]
MKNRLPYVLCELDALERNAWGTTPLHRLDARAKLLVTAIYLATMLSVPLSRLSEILLYALFPILTASMGGLRPGALLRKSLAVVPFAALIGIFNILYDRTPVFRIGPLTVTDGWIAFLSIVLRGLLSVEALLVLIGTTGFYGICRGMQRLGVPRFLTVQLLFVHRYLYVLIEEAIRMRQAREARSFDRRTLPLPLWGTLVGQLLIRACDRAEQIHRAMLARGFAGRIPDCTVARTHWRRQETIYVLAWGAALLLVRTAGPVETLTRWLR